MNLKKLLTISALSFGIVSSANAGWIMTPYMGASAGMGRQTVHTNGFNTTADAESYGAMFGIDLPIIRVEAEYNYLTTDALEVNATMLNAYIKIPSLIVKPYFGAGVGTVFGGTANIDSTAAYQAMIGATIDILKLPIKPEIEARAIYAKDIINTDLINSDLLQYEVRLKLKYVF